MFRSTFAVVLALLILAGPAAAFNWYTQTVDSAGDLDGEVSLALDSSGRAHVSYYDATNQDLIYTYWNGSSWARTVVDGDGNTGMRCSMVLDSNNRPHISYFDPGTYGIKYAFWDGAAWQKMMVQSGVYRESDTSIAVNSAGTHVAYFDYNTWQLMYAFWNGSAWTRTAIDVAGDQNCFVSMKLGPNGKPCFAYARYLSDGFNYRYSLKYAYWNDSSFTTEVVPTEPHSGAYCSLALDNAGNPCISYWQVQRYYYEPEYDYVAKRTSTGWTTQWFNSVYKDVSRVGPTSIATDSRGQWGYARRSGDDSAELCYSPEDQSTFITTYLENYTNHCSLAFGPRDKPHICYVDTVNKDIKYIYAGPDGPTVTDDGTFTTRLDTLSVRWNVSSELTDYQYAMGTSPTNLIVDWKTSPTTGSAAETGLSLQPGTKYYWYVKARDYMGNWISGQSDGITAALTTTPGQARTLPVGTLVYLENMVVTSKTSDPGGMWLEDIDRTGAIYKGFPVTNPGWNGIPVGNCYNFIGRINWQDGLPGFIELDCKQADSKTIEPLGFTNRGVANDKRESLSYKGINPTGLLVTVWGKVTRVDSTKQFFYIDDGSRLVDGNKPVGGSQETGLRILCGSYGTSIAVAPGDMVRVTGTRSIQKLILPEQRIVNGENRSTNEMLYVPAVCIRGSNDVVKY